MRVFASTVLLLFSVGVYALGDCNGNQNCNENNYGPTINKGGNAYAGAIGVGKGGNAHQGQFQIGINKQSQDQYQKQYQGQDQGQGQFQGNVGLNKAVGQGNTTTITSTSKLEAEPAIAPAIAPGDPTAPCYVTLGGSAAGGGVASIGFSGYKYDTICGAMEFYRVVGQDPAHAKQAAKAVNVAYHNLMNRMHNEMGETEYTKATGDKVEDAGTTASYSYPTQDGGFMKVSFEKLDQVGMDAEEVEAERDITEPLR